MGDKLSLSQRSVKMNLYISPPKFTDALKTTHRPPGGGPQNIIIDSWINFYVIDSTVAINMSTEGNIYWEAFNNLFDTQIFNFMQ